jgi:hypothetical protein
VAVLDDGHLQMYTVFGEFLREVNLSTVACTKNDLVCESAALFLVAAWRCVPDAWHSRMSDLSTRIRRAH